MVLLRSMIYKLLLDMHRNPIGAAGVRALSSWSGLAHVTELNLSHCELGDEGVAELVSSVHLRSLRKLRVAHNDLTDRSMELIAHAPQLGQLVHLDLSGNPTIGARGARTLVNSPVLPETLRRRWAARAR